MNDPLGLFGDEQDNDPLGLFVEEKPKAGIMTGIKSSFAGVGNMADTALSTLAGGAAAIFGDDQEALRIAEEMEARRKQRDQWANPEGQELSTMGKVAGTLATLPMQVVGMGLSPAETSYQAKASGESNSAAIKAGLVDAAGNAIGIALPGFKQGSMAVRAATGAGANVAQELATKKAIQSMLETEEGKAKFAPNMDDALVLAIVGGGFGAALGRNVKPTGNKKLDAIRSEAIKQKAPETVVPEAPEQLKLFDQFEERSPISPYQTEMAPDMWRVDENGIPIRADLSMEAQNMQQPLQRNLFGDELDVNFPRDPNKPLTMDGDIPGVERFSEPVNFRNDPENQRPLTEAIDSMEPGARAEALATTQMGRELPADGPMLAAKMQADIAAASGDNFKGFNARMKKQGGGLLIGNKKVDVEQTPDGFVAKVGDKVVGYLRSNITPEQRAQLDETANVDMVKVEDDFKGKGVGKALYDAWTNANEGQVAPSGKTSPAAWKLWKRDNPAAVETFVQQEAGRIASGADEGMVLGNITDPQVRQQVSSFNTRTRNQGGGLKIDWSENNKIENSLAKSEDGSFIPPNPDVAAVLAKAVAEGKDGRLWTYTQSGSTSAAMKTGSAAIKAASEIVQNAVKRADLMVRESVFPAETSLRKLPKLEIEELSTLFKDEMFSGERYDGDILTKHLSVKQLEAYRNMRDLFDKTLDVQNEARLAKGQEPISPKEAYLSSRWKGDFRRPVYDADGKLVWYLADSTKRGLEAQSKALLKEFPDLVVDPKKDHTVRGSRGKTDLQSMYSTMLDLLGRNDPAIAKIKEAIEAQTVAEGENTLAQTKHFEKKANIRGFVGDRPGMGGPKESIAMFQQQIQYAKNAFQWAEMQKAADDIKSIVSDPTLQEQQPNNVKYIREYFKNAVGMGESQVAKALDDSIRSGLGISPDIISKGVGIVKSLFITQKLAASAGYTVANLVQTSNVLPYLMNLRSQGYKGNPAVAAAIGFPAGMMMGMSHYLKSVGGDYMSHPMINSFFKDAFQYAEDNGVTARSVYDEAPLDTGNPVVNGISRVASKTMTVPETFVRSMAFMTYAQMLKDSGKFTDQSKLFQKAEELVNMSMVDYRESERPMMFAKAGTAGNFLNTLQTYPMSFYNQWGYMLGEATKGRPAGLVTAMALQYAVAGAMGLPGFDDADKLYRWMRDEFVSTSTWNKMAKSPFFSDPKLWMLENFGDASVYGALSDESGIGMTSRVAAPGAGAMLQSPLGPVMDIGKQVGNLGKAVMDPPNSTKWAQSAMSSVPVGLQGLLETAPFMKDHTYVEREDGKKVFMKTTDLADRKGGYARSPEEVETRQWGVRSQAEVKARDVAYATSSANQSLTRRGGELIDQYYDAARRGDGKRAAELATLYMDITDKEISDTQTENQIKEEFYTDIQKNTDKSKTARQLLNAARMSKILEATKGLE